jgi:regulator of replication initiation timing
LGGYHLNDPNRTVSHLEEIIKETVRAIKKMRKDIAPITINIQLKLENYLSKITNRYQLDLRAALNELEIQSHSYKGIRYDLESLDERWIIQKLS